MSELGLQGKELLPEFLTLFLDHVCDNIWSVRQNAAVSVAAMVEAYGDGVFLTLAQLSTHASCISWPCAAPHAL